LGCKIVKRYFLVMSPYNLLLSYSLAMRSHENVLILLPFFRDETLISAFMASNNEDEVFEDIIMLKSYKYKSIVAASLKAGKELGLSAFLKNLKCRTETYIRDRIYNKRIIDSIPLKNSEVFTFNDTLFESQLLMSKNRENNGKNYYVEDGLAVYLKHPSPSPRIPPLTHFISLNKFLGRSRYSDIKHHATHPLLDGCIVNYPEMVRDDIKVEVTPLPPYKEFLSKSAFVSNVVSHYNLSFVEDAGRELCMILPGNLFEISMFYGIPLQDLLDIYIEIIEVLKDEMDVIIKFHPREPLEVMDKLKAIDDSVLALNSSIPSELLFIYAKDNLRAVIGDISTNLVSATFLSNSSVISTARIASAHVKADAMKQLNDFIELFKKFKIEIPEDISEIIETI